MKIYEFHRGLLRGGQPASPWVEGNGELHDLGDVRVCLEFSNQAIHEVYCLISDINDIIINFSRD